jgi:hypothetical protein
MADDLIPVKPLTKKETQDLFQQCNLLVKIETKELSERLYRERHANPRKSGQPFCTYSQLVSYHDSHQNETIRRTDI